MGNEWNEQDFFCKSIQDFIRWWANRVVRGAHLPSHEGEDVEQDLRLHLFRRIDRFDPARGKASTFAACVIERKAKSLLRWHRAQRRHAGVPVVSLDEASSHGDDGSGGRTDQHAYLEATALRVEGDPNAAIRTIDVERVIEALPPNNRHLARLLMEERVADVARRTRIPRGTLYERIAKIRGAFEAAGLKRSA